MSGASQIGRSARVVIAAADITIMATACRVDSRSDYLGDKTPKRFGLGHTPTAAEIAAVDIDASPSGAGLPAGSGTPEQGAPIYAASCQNKDAAWTALKWLAGAPEAEAYYFQAEGRLPAASTGAEAVPAIAKFPDADVVLTQPQFAEAPYPWAADQPRFSLQNAIEAAIAGTATPADALAQAQKETEDWLAKQPG